MMDTVLNLGLTDEVVVGLGEATGNPRFAWDAYRRLINMFGNVVMGVEHEHFEAAFDVIKKKYRVTLDTDVPAEGLEALCGSYKKVYRKHVGSNFPQDPIKQLELAIEAVFRSWNKPTAISYRRINEITGLVGTAVNVQSMVYGNMGEDSGTGVAFTRDPSTGKNEFYGEFLINAQGEDVVAGIRTPQPIKGMVKWNNTVFKKLNKVRLTLEKHYRGHAGHRVHHRAWNPLHAADPQRQEDWCRSGQDRRRHGQGTTDRSQDGPASGSRAGPHPAPASELRLRRQEEDPSIVQGAARIAWCCFRRTRLHRRRSRGASRQG